MNEDDRLAEFSDHEVRQIANSLLREMGAIAKELGIELPTGGNCVHAIRDLKKKLNKIE